MRVETMGRAERVLGGQVTGRWWLAALLGAVSATGFQPLALWPVALASMGLFALTLMRCTTWRQAALLGWLFGIGHFTIGNSWIAAAFTHQSEMPAILGWAAVPLVGLYLGIFPALAAGAAHALTSLAANTQAGFARKGGAPFLLAFAGCWIIAEWLRGWLFTGYAWNPFGIILLGPFDRPGLAALAPWLGTYALSGLAVLLSGGLLLAALRREFVRVLLASMLLAGGMYWPAGAAYEGSLPVTVVQPDLAQHRINDPLFYEPNFQRLARLSPPAETGVPRLVLWPESGLADYLHDGYPQRYYDRTTALGSPEYARARIGRAIGDGSVLLTGAVDLEITEGRAVGAYNSVTAISPHGAIIGSYSKAHLVPFGEYLPLRALLEPIGLSRLVPGSIDFLPGPGPATIDLGRHGQAGVQICYEIVFSGQVVDRANRPDYIFNPSNDGWFGAAGPPQHLAQARLRAVEEGLPVLRSTVTGISAVIDARGVVRAHLPMNRMDRIDTLVPPSLPPTLFAMMGNWLPLFWSFMLLCSTFVVMRRLAR